MHRPDTAFEAGRTVALTTLRAGPVSAASGGECARVVARQQSSVALLFFGGLGRTLVDVEHPFLDDGFVTVLIGLVGAQTVLQAHPQTE